MTVFCWNMVVFTATWHLYFRVTFSDTAAPEFHRFILKVRRTKHMNYGVPGGGSITMGYFRLERLPRGWFVGPVSAGAGQSGGWTSMLAPGDLEVLGLPTRGLGQITTDTGAMTTIRTSGSFWSVKTRSCLPTIFCWSQCRGVCMTV